MEFYIDTLLIFIIGGFISYLFIKRSKRWTAFGKAGAILLALPLLLWAILVSYSGHLPSGEMGMTSLLAGLLGGAFIAPFIVCGTVCLLIDLFYRFVIKKIK